MFRTLIFTTAILGSLSVPAVHAQKPDSGAFFVRLGKDTIALERYVRTPLLLVAEGVLRTPQTRRYKLTVTFKDDGTVSWYEVVNAPVAGVPNSAPLMRSVGTYLGDSVRIETWVSAVSRPTRTVAARNSMLPLQLPFYSTYETAIMRARNTATDTVTITMLAAGAQVPYLLQRIGRDSVTLYNPQGGTIRARVDQEGRLLGYSGAQTTFKIDVLRANWLDVDAYEKRYAAADAEGKAIGALSPRDSVEFAVGKVSGMISYSRPSKRGRRIFGGIVPWGQVWRTGANAATAIEFTDPVEINDVQIPAGKYTLWTIPDQEQWQLIINKQTGQWGTAYDEKQDLVRIPVASESVPVPVETFTIAATPRGETGAVVTLTWDRTRVVVPIRQAR